MNDRSRFEPFEPTDTGRLLLAAERELARLVECEHARRCGEAVLLRDADSDVVARWGWLGPPPPPLLLWQRRVDELLELCRAEDWPFASESRTLLARCSGRTPRDWPDSLELAARAELRHLALADAYLARGLASEALHCLREVLPEVRPGAERAGCLVGMARAHEALGHVRLALGVWERAAAEDAGRLDAQVQTLYLAARLSDARRERAALDRIARTVAADSGALAVEIERLRRRAGDTDRVLADDRRLSAADSGRALVARARAAGGAS